MLRLSKKVEYGILSLQFLAENADKKSTAKEISEQLDLSFDFLSKTLQVLMKKGLIVSHQGIKGGYKLARASAEISLSDIIEALEGKPELVECISDHKDKECGREATCTIKKPIRIIQDKIIGIFDETKLSHLSANEIVELEIKMN